MARFHVKRAKRRAHQPEKETPFTMSTQRDRDRDNRSRQAGNDQRERQGNRPWGRASAIIVQPGSQRGETKAHFVLIGNVWETENGNLKIVLSATPQQWNDPHYRREVVLSKNEEPNGGGR